MKWAARGSNVALARWSGLSVDFIAVKTLRPATLAREAT